VTSLLYWLVWCDDIYRFGGRESVLLRNIDQLMVGTIVRLIYRRSGYQGGDIGGDFSGI
jgi:hypothetical protein